MRNLKKYRDYWLFLLFPLGGAVAFCLGFLIHWSLALAVFPWAYCVNRVSSQIRCPRCGNPVGLVSVRLFGLSFDFDSPFTPDKCRMCGESLIHPETPLTSDTRDDV